MARWPATRDGAPSSRSRPRARVSMPGGVFHAAAALGQLGEGAGGGVTWYASTGHALFTWCPRSRSRRAALRGDCGACSQGPPRARGAGGDGVRVPIANGVYRVLVGEGVTGVVRLIAGSSRPRGGAYRDVRLDEALAGVTVADAMLREVATLPADLSLGEVAQQHFLRSGYGSYPVMRGDAVVGLLCLRDVLRRSAEERAVTSVQAAMTPLSPGIVAEPQSRC